MAFVARDRGAAAVEFALVLLPLTLLTFGIIVFGYALHLQTMLDNAARDGVRQYTLSGADPQLAAEDAVANALAPTALASGYAIDFVPAGGCSDTELATVTVTSTEELPLSGMFGWNLTLEGSGSMRCTG